MSYKREIILCTSIKKTFIKICGFFVVIASCLAHSATTDPVYHNATKQLYIPVVDIQGSNPKNATLRMNNEGRFELVDLRDSSESVAATSASYSGDTGQLQLPLVNADGVLYNAILSLYSTTPEIELELVSLNKTAREEFDSESCGINNELFTVAPMAVEGYFQIDPLGATNPSAHTFPTVHTYMMLTDKTNAVTVYAPGDIRITSVSQVRNITGGSIDHVIAFTPCTEVTGYFDHVTTLEANFQSLIGSFDNCRRYFAGDDEYEYCSKTVTLNVTAGSILGYAGGNGALSAALDFGLRDNRTMPIAYLSPGRLVATDQLYVVCPYDYYKEGVIFEQLQEKLKESRKTSPICGTVAYDLIDTLQGLWYLKDSTGFGEEQHIALVPSNTQPLETGVLSIGNSSLGTDAYYFDFSESAQVNSLFIAVTADNKIYCWDNLRNRATSLASGSSQSLSGYIFAKMNDSRSLIIERINSSGSCPNNPDTLSFSSNAIVFER